MTNKKEPTTKDLSISVQVIEQRIYLIRGCKVMLDSDLAELYQVETRRLNEQVKRNISRFPEDFMFQLSKEEYEVLLSQIAIASGQGGRRNLPHVFTQEGIAMLSSVLNSERAIQVNITIMRAFVKLRQLFVSNQDLAKKFDDLEQLTKSKLKEHDDKFQAVFDAIKKLIKATIPPKPEVITEQPKRVAGFVSEKKEKKKD